MHMSMTRSYEAHALAERLLAYPEMTPRIATLAATDCVASFQVLFLYPSCRAPSESMVCHRLSLIAI